MSQPKRSKTITLDVIREAKPAKGIKKIYDKRCPGFFAAVTAKGTVSFYAKFWNRALKKQDEQWIGRYHPEALTIDMARTEAHSLIGRAGVGEDVSKTARQTKAQAIRESLTVAELIDRYVDFITPRDGNDDAIASWDHYRSVLDRFLRPRFETMQASELTNKDIAKLITDIRTGKYTNKFKPGRKYKASNANAHNARDVMSALFTWAAEAGRDLIPKSPCHDLPELPAKTKRDRVLTEDEIRTLWWGLDRPDLPWPRKIALALKFQLCTMLRAKEFLTGRVDEITKRDTADARINVPPERVKLRRPIVQPLSSLAQEILDEAITSEDQEFLFPTSTGAAQCARALTIAVNGKAPYRRKDGRRAWGVVGICEFLEMRKWTPHDLRRTCASIAEDLDFTDREIGYCLDHTADKGEDKAARVTRVYARGGVIRKKSRKLETKERVLNAVDEALRDIIGMEPPVTQPLPLAA